MARASSRAKVIASRTVFTGPVFKVLSDKVREPGGVVVRRDVVRHSGSIVIMAVRGSAQRKQVLLVKQYRHAIGGYLWELPAGRVDHGESLLAGAKRELLEETGFTANQWQRALHFYVSPGFLDETMTVFLASDLQAGKAQPEADEFIELRFFPLKTAQRMALNGSLKDAKSIAALLWYLHSRPHSTLVLR